MTEGMLESHFDDDSLTQASEPSLRESTRPSRSNTPESAKSLTPRGSFTQHPLEAGGEHGRSMSDLDIASQNPPPLPAILVMGVTGAGKSHFIRVVTGDSAVAVGHNLRSGRSPCHVPYIWGAILTMPYGSTHCAGCRHKRTPVSP